MKINFEMVEKYAWPFLKAVLILVAGYYVVKMLVKIPKHLLEKTRLDKSLVDIIVNALKFSGYLVVILSALNAMGISTAGLLAALSAIVVSLALALKDSLSSIAGGFLLLAVPRYVTGDYVAINDDEGFVESINLLQTTIRTNDNRHITYSNGVILNSRVTNYTWEGKRRIDLKFSIPYTADIEKIKMLANDVVKSHPFVLPENEGKTYIRAGEYGDSAVVLFVLVWIKCENYWDVYFDLTEQLRARFIENGFDIPFNQLDVHIDR